MICTDEFDPYESYGSTWMKDIFAHSLKMLGAPEIMLGAPSITLYRSANVHNNLILLKHDAFCGRYLRSKQKKRLKYVFRPYKY